MSENCVGFESYHARVASGEGNKLEWMDLFHDYQGQLYLYAHIQSHIHSPSLLSYSNVYVKILHCEIYFSCTYFIVCEELIDAELGNFCELHDAVPSEVFQLIENFVNDSEKEEFVPLFLKTMSEEPGT